MIENEKKSKKYLNFEKMKKIKTKKMKIEKMEKLDLLKSVKKIKFSTFGPPNSHFIYYFGGFGSFLQVSLRKLTKNVVPRKICTRPT